MRRYPRLVVVLSHFMMESCTFSFLHDELENGNRFVQTPTENDALLHGYDYNLTIGGTKYVFTSFAFNKNWEALRDGYGEDQAVNVVLSSTDDGTHSFRFCIHNTTLTVTHESYDHDRGSAYMTSTFEVDATFVDAMDGFVQFSELIRARI